MGRPVKKDINGVAVFGTYASTAVGIRVIANFGGSVRDDVYIVKQKGAKSYKVIDVSDGASQQCALANVDVNDAANSLGTNQMIMSGRIVATSAVVTLAKLQKRTAIDFNGNRYTWSLANDSSSDDILLVAL